MITVLIVDDSGPLQESLRDLLAMADDMELIATAINGIEAVEKAHLLSPNVAVMDISMPLMDGIEAAGQIRDCCILTRIIMLSGHKEAEYIRRALEAGARGYVLKDEAAGALLEGIRAIHEGKHYFSHQIAEIGETYWLGGP